MNKRNNFIALSVFIALLAVAAGSRFSVTANSTAAQPVWQKSRQVAVPLPQYAAFDLESASDLATVAAGPSVVRYADVDGDGIADLIAVKNGNLQLQRGQAATEFGLPEILETGSSTTALAVGDINGDGYPELLALNASNSTVTVWGQADQSQTVRGEANRLPLSILAIQPVLPNATALAVVDVNQDDIQDVVVSAGDGLVLCLGTNDGLAAGQHMAAPAGVSLNYLATAPSASTVWTVDTASQQLLTWEWQSGQMAVTSTFPMNVSVSALTVADLNVDNHLDVLAATADGALAVLMGNSQGGFGGVQLFPAVAGTTRLEVTQMNVDGTLDVVMNDSAGQLVVLPGTGDGGFGQPQVLPASGASAWETGRMNLDAMADVITLESGAIRTFVTQQTARTVTTTQDNGDNESPTAGSLRAALLAAQAGDSIVFAIPGAQVTGNIFIIKPPASAPLPPLDKNGITINGDSQAATSNTNPNGPEIFIDASSAGVATGLRIISAGNNVIHNLGIVGASSVGIEITGAGATNNRIESCYIGTNADATDDNPNDLGIAIRSTAAVNTIGGSTAAARNIISGNNDGGILIEGVGTTNNIIRNNLIGLNRTATAAVGNGGNGITIRNGASNNVIGGTGLSDGNLIGGNTGASTTGITLDGSISNTIQGNLIGTNASRADLGNGGDGIRIINDSSLNLVGGTGDNAANGIAFNGGNGVTIGVNLQDTGTIRNSLRRNSIYANDKLGIDLANNGVTNSTGSGPNALQPRPKINSVTVNGSNIVIVGKLDGTAPNTAIVELFANIAGSTQPASQPTQLYLDSVTPEADGDFSKTVTAPSGSFTITGTSTDAQGNTSEFGDAATVTAVPDLIVQTPNVTPTSVTAGGTVTVTFTIRNQGSAATSVTSTATIVLSNDNTVDAEDQVLTTVSTQPLAAAASVNLTANNVRIPASATPGAKFIGIRADSGNAIAESNENNNTATDSLTIAAPQPDLVVGALTLSASATPPGGSLTVNVTVSNAGSGNAGASITRIVLSTDAVIGTGDVVLTSINTGSIAGGSALPLTANITIAANVTPGNYFIGALVDATNAVDESAEDNNTATQAFSVSGLPDLVVTALEASPTQVIPGNNVTLTFTIRNQGGTTADGATHDVVLSNDEVIRNGEDVFLISRPTGSLTPGATATITVTIPIPANTSVGNKFIGVIADATNTVTEAVETNNTRSTAIVVVDTIVPVVKIVSPNGGEAVASGRPFERPIEWTATDNDRITGQELRLSTDGGVSYPTLIMTGIPADSRTLVWNVPGGLNTTSARVQIIVTDASGNIARANSDANFLIAPPPVIQPGVKLGKTGKIVFVAANSNIQSGAKLRITVGSVTETFDITNNTVNGKILVKASARSTPGNRTPKEFLPSGTTSTWVVVNPNGVTSAPFQFIVP